MRANEFESSFIHIHIWYGIEDIGLSANSVFHVRVMNPQISYVAPNVFN